MHLKHFGLCLVHCNHSINILLLLLYEGGGFCMQFRNMNHLCAVWGSEDQKMLEGWKVIFFPVLHFGFGHGQSWLLKTQSSVLLTYVLK